MLFKVISLPDETFIT